VYHVMLIASPSNPPVNTLRLVVGAMCNKTFEYHVMLILLLLQPVFNNSTLVMDAMCNKVPSFPSHITSQYHVNWQRLLSCRLTYKT